jgi:GH15 family glucan-1,4-alpha-glucosidase
MDRAVRDVEEFGFEGPVDKWRATRDAIKAEVLEKGFDPVRNTFTQSYGSRELDASTLMVPLVGFLPPSDPRVVGTVDAIQADLGRDSFVLRYDAQNAGEVDGLSGREGAFLACSFWLVDNLEMIGRHGEAVELFEKLLGLSNDVGLLAEEYDDVAKRLVGNFPQAFSHVSLVNSAVNLQRAGAWQGADDHSHKTRVSGRKVSIGRRLRHPAPRHHPGAAHRRTI